MKKARKSKGGTHVLAQNKAVKHAGIRSFFPPGKGSGHMNPPFTTTPDFFRGTLWIAFSLIAVIFDVVSPIAIADCSSTQSPLLAIEN